MRKWRVAAAITSASGLRGSGMAVLAAAGVAAGCAWPGSGPAGAKIRAATVRQACPAESAVPPGKVTHPYDRQVLAYAPAMYLTMGSPASGSEPDLSGHGHPGTYLPAGSRPATARLPDGSVAAEFNGRGQYLRVPSAASLSVPHTGCLTIQAWIRPTTLSFPDEEGTGYVYFLGKGATDKQEYALRMYSLRNSEVPARPSRVSAYVFNLSGGIGSGTYFQDKLQAGAWIMVTFVIDDQPSAAWPRGYVAIYKNSQLRGQVSISQFHVTPRASTAPLCIGTRQLESFFEGAIGKVAVFNYVLSAQQVATVYHAMQ